MWQNQSFNDDLIQKPTLSIISHSIHCQLHSSAITSFNHFLDGLFQLPYSNLLHRFMLLLCLVAQSCPTLRFLMDCGPPGSSVCGILQARILDGLPCPPPGDLPNPGICAKSPTLQADSLPVELPGKVIIPAAAAAAAKSLQSCLTLCDHIDGSPPGSPVPGILQARILEWVAISFSNA